MADQNLEILVDVDIGSAIANLEKLQSQLMGLAKDIEYVDSIGTDGISISTELKSIEDDLFALELRLRQFEARNSLNIDTNLRGMNFSGLSGGGGGLFAGMFGANRPTSGGGGGGGSGTTSPIGQLQSLFDKLKKPIESTDLRMTDMHNALAKLIPLILVLVGAIPALYTALIGLAAAAISAAAALLAIGGFGALGVGLQDGEFDMQRLSDVLSDIRDEFIEAFGPLSESLEPLFMDAVDGLSILFDQIAAEGGALMQLTDDARAFGNFALSFIPSALASMAAMVETMRPVFSMMADALQNASILRTLTALTLDIIPAVAAMTSAILNALPTLIRFSAGFADMVGAIVRFVSLIGKVISILPISAEMLGLFVSFVLSAFSAVALLNSQLIGGSIVKFGQLIASTIPALNGFSVASLGAAGALAKLKLAIIGITSLTVVGAILTVITAAVSTLGSQMRSTESDIRSTTDALREFDNVAGNTKGAFNPYGGDAPVSGAKAAGGGQSAIVIEPSGNGAEQRSDVKSANWRMSRKTDQGGR